MGIISMFKLLSGMALTQAAELDDERTIGGYRTHSRTGQTISHRADVTHKVRSIRVNGVNARLHMCLNHRKQIVPCDHIHVGFTYDRNLVTAIMNQLPRFVHKHTIVYKMYTTLKLYYLHQQELLNQVLAILKEHIHSRELASTLFAYMKQMHGANFKWVASIEALLKSHINLSQTGMYRLINHMHLVHSLHTM